MVSKNIRNRIVYIFLVVSKKVVMGNDVPIRYACWHYDGREGDYEY